MGALLSASSTLARVFWIGYYVLLYTDHARHFATVGYELDDLHDDLSVDDPHDDTSV